MQHVKIKRVVGKVYDIFFGQQGWDKENHSRVVIVGKDFVKFMSGAQLPPDVLRHVIKEFQ